MERISAVILDDEKHVVNLIKALLPWDEIGIEYKGEAYNGEDGLSLVLSVHPDIVITDIMMPGMSGLDLIEETHRRFPEIEFIIISGYREFDYAQTAIRSGVENYLLKPIDRDELISTLSKLKASILRRRDIARQIELSDEEKKGKSLSEAIFGEVDKTGSLLVVKIDSGSSFLSDDEYRVLHDKAGSLAMKTGEAEAICYRNDIIAILLKDGSDPVESSEVISYALKAIPLLFPRIMLSFFLYPADGSSLQDVYQCIDKLLPFRYSIKGLILPQRIPSSDDSSIISWWSSMSDKMIDSIDNAVIAQSLDAFENAIDKGYGLFQTLRDAGRIFGSKAESRGYNGWSWYEEQLLPSISIAPDADELLIRFRMHLMTFLVKIASEKEKAERKPIRDAVRYMNSHFTDSDFSLESVSAIAGLSPTYFSLLFRKETGKGFQEFLLDIRINKAKDMLRDTQLTIYEIADKVGYSDAKHFSKVFQKKTGVKPNEFRKLYG